MWVTKKNEKGKSYCITDKEFDKFIYWDFKKNSTIQFKCIQTREYSFADIDISRSGNRYLLIENNRYYRDYFEHVEDTDMDEKEFNLMRELANKNKTKPNKIEMLRATIKESEKLLDQIKKEDSNFDPGYKLEAGLSRVSEFLQNYENKEFDFRNLHFEGYKLADDTATSAKDVWFEKEDNDDDNIHIYVPEFVSIDNVSSEDYKYIVVVEVLVGCQHYKTLILDAKTWIADTENLGIEQNYKDMSSYILIWAFKDRKTEAY